ncbi:MAG: Uma2 family endonuclease [Selenomonas sp.]|uniref:Uma2 family endonuclease n=1 Tax=Selenomonas sp. TaxID=2053611 RepID=UPI0025DC9650|nr:Uma2 family endonuclease [Selenomonas sp.]MCI6100097.1 Uma2 family endonuclease [Selenomonas sp.]MCI6231818.1 Uma2 family endonuclease [Selenomonas sp.]
MENLAHIDPPPMELIDGNVVMMSPRPRPMHNTVISNLTRVFGNYLLDKPCRVYSDGVDVHLDEKNLFVPDVMIVCNQDIIKTDAIYGAPDLVVEVLSPSTARNDRGPKLQVYGRAGVREYWIISPLARTVEVYKNQDGTLVFDDVYADLPDEDLARMDEEDRKDIHMDIKVSLYDDLIVSVRDVFFKL